VWFDGWRLVFCTVLDGNSESCRPKDGLWLQRAACAACLLSWTLRPAFLTARRSYAADFVEAASLQYLRAASATYARVGRLFGCSPTALWGWIGSLGRGICAGEVVAEAVRLDYASPAADLIPSFVPQDHPKALSSDRKQHLLRALQVLVALTALVRVLAVPASDPSPLRWSLTVGFLTFRNKALVRVRGWSPGIELAQRAPPG